MSLWCSVTAEWQSENRSKKFGFFFSFLLCCAFELNYCEVVTVVVVVVTTMMVVMQWNFKVTACRALHVISIVALIYSIGEKEMNFLSIYTLHCCCCCIKSKMEIMAHRANRNPITTLLAYNYLLLLRECN